MSEVINYSNLKLFNLVEYGYSKSTISKIVSFSGNNKASEHLINLAIGYTPTSKRIINDICKIDTSYYSVYCLIYFGIDNMVCEKIKQFYSSLNILSLRINELSIKVKLQKPMLQKIKFAVNELSNFIKTDTGNLILDSENSNVINDAKEEIMNSMHKLIIYPDSVNVNNFDLFLNKHLIFRNRNSKHQSIREYFAASENIKDAVVFEKCKGSTLEKIGADLGYTRERIRQIIKKQIESYPVFENELEYKNLFSIYKFDDKEIESLGADSILIEYVKLKYSKYIVFDSLKSSFDFINDFNLFDSELGKYVLENKNLIVIHNELIEKDFVVLFKKFVTENKIHRFLLDEIFSIFNNYLARLQVNDRLIVISNTEDDIKIKTRKLSYDKSFIEVKKRYFIVYNPDELSLDFIELMRDYLKHFVGYGSIEYLFKHNKELCKKNNIVNANELYALMKTMFQKEFCEIIFDRNPVIVQKGIKKDEFLENLIQNLDLPCTLDDLLKQINEMTGLKEQSILANFGDVFAKFKNTEGLISLNDDISTTDKEIINNLIDCDCISYNYFKQKLSIALNFDNKKIGKLLNYYNLKRIGYIKTNTCIFSIKYSNRNNAMLEQLKKMDYIINENRLSQITNIELFLHRMYGFADKCYLIKINRDCYLNLVKRQQCELVYNLKKDIKSSLLQEKIYTLNDYIESEEYKEVLIKNDEYKDFLFSFNQYSIVEYLILTSQGINYIKSLGKVIFSKSNLSLSSIIYKIVSEYKSLSLLKLREILYNDYGIKKYVYNTQLSDLGFYCPTTSEKVYLNKNYYEEEIESILNGEYS